MGYDLRSESGTDLQFNAAGWGLLLSLARVYGWMPHGCLPPEGVDAAAWEGDYDTNDGGRVSRDDANAMAVALERALADPERAERERDISRALNEAVRQMEIETFGEDVALEEEEEPLTTEDETLHALIRFLRAGGFTID